MSKMFGISLARIREESGFLTAYAFYHKNGGKKVFPFTYSFYLKIERGSSLPRPAWLRLILNFLRIPPEVEGYRRLLLDYLADLVKDAESFRSLIVPLLRPPCPAPVSGKAAKRLVSEQAFHLTLEQFQAVAASPASHWCFECIVNSRKPIDPRLLVDRLGYSFTQVQEALDSLSRAKLVRRTTGGRYTSPLSCRFYVFPKDYPGFQEDRDRLVAATEAQARRKGKDIFHGGMMLRIEEEAAQRLTAALAEVMESASAYSVYRETDGSAFFLIDARVRRILPF